MNRNQSLFLLYRSKKCPLLAIFFSNFTCDFFFVLFLWPTFILAFRHITFVLIHWYAKCFCDSYCSNVSLAIHVDLPDSQSKRIKITNALSSAALLLWVSFDDYFFFVFILKLSNICVRCGPLNCTLPLSFPNSTVSDLVHDFDT